MMGADPCNLAVDSYLTKPAAYRREILKQVKKPPTFIFIVDKFYELVFISSPNVKVPGLFQSGVKGKTVKVRHIPAVAVIGDKGCDKATLCIKRGRRSHEDDP